MISLCSFTCRFTKVLKVCLQHFMGYGIFAHPLSHPLSICPSLGVLCFGLWQAPGQLVRPSREAVGPVCGAPSLWVLWGASVYVDSGHLARDF